MEAVRKAMEFQKKSLPPRTTGVGRGEGGNSGEPAQIIGVHLEGPFLNPVKCGALAALSFSEPGEYALMELLEGFEDIVKIITVAPEIRGAIGIVKKVSGMGIMVSMGHSDATYAEAEDGFRAGARGITHIFNAMRGIHHREPGIAGFGLLNKDIYIEVIADPYHLHAKTIELIFRMKKPDRILRVSDAVKETVTGASGKRCVADESGKLLGGGMTITESSQRLIQLGYDEGNIIDCITKNPAKYLGK
jgi:N-acetylglucosamine-6-phosphate deacetylase